MSQRDGPAVHVDLFRVQTEFAYYRERLRGECLVQLHQPDVLELQPCDLQRLRYRMHRSDAHNLRCASGGGERNKACDRFHAERCGPLCAGHDGHRRAVGGLRGIAGGHGALGVESRLQFCQGFCRSVRPRTFIDLEAAFFFCRFGGSWFGRAFGPLHRHDLIRKAALGDRLQRLLVAGECKVVGILARDMEALAHTFRGEAHRQVRGRHIVYQPGIGADLMAAHRNHAHRFGAARHHHRCATATDTICRLRNGLQTGGAEAVDGHGGNFDGQACTKTRDASHVHALLGFGVRAAQDYVVDFILIELGNARERSFDGGGGQIVRARRGQASSSRFTDGGANGAYDHCILHD